jgi:hypothetical protein
MPENSGVTMRLSKKGWNNVLIFGVLLIIFIFNFSPKLRLSSSNQQSVVISPGLTIVEIQTPDYVLTRIGRNWQRTPNLGLSSEKLQEIVNNWQSVPLDTLMEQELPFSNFIFTFFVAEQEQPIVVQLHQQQDDHYILQVNDQQFFSLPVDKLPLFLGR